MPRSKAKPEERASENEDDPEVYESSGDEWVEQKPKKRGSNRRLSQRLSKKPKVSHAEASSDDDANSVKPKSKNGIKKQKNEKEKVKKAEEEEEVEEEEVEDEEEEDSMSDSSDDSSAGGKKNRKVTPVGGRISADFVNGGFLILKKDCKKGVPPKRPSLWRIDGKALLQKYECFEENGMVKHRNTSIYTGWSAVDKDLYIPINVKVLQHQGQNMTVEMCLDAQNETTNSNDDD